LEGLITKNINKSSKNVNKNFSMKHKYTTEQSGNNDKEGTVESKQKSSQWNSDLNNDIRETENIQKSMVKKKRKRQFLPMARKQDNWKKRWRKEETQLMEETQKRNEAREKEEYENVSGALLNELG